MEQQLAELVVAVRALQLASISLGLFIISGALFVRSGLNRIAKAIESREREP